MAEMSADALRNAAVQQFRTRKGQLQRVPVPEWSNGDDLAYVYFYEEMPIGDWEIFAQNANGNLASAALYGFVLKARDAEGKRLFSLMSVDEIRRGDLELDIEVLTRLAGEMGIMRQPGAPTLEEESKKP